MENSTNYILMGLGVIILMFFMFEVMTNTDKVNKLDIPININEEQTFDPKISISDNSITQQDNIVRNRRNNRGNINRSSNSNNNNNSGTPTPININVSSRSSSSAPPTVPPPTVLPTVPPTVPPPTVPPPTVPPPTVPPTVPPPTVPTMNSNCHCQIDTGRTILCNC